MDCKAVEKKLTLGWAGGKGLTFVPSFFLLFFRPPLPSHITVDDGLPVSASLFLALHCSVLVIGDSVRFSYSLQHDRGETTTSCCTVSYIRAFFSVWCIVLSSPPPHPTLLFCLFQFSVFCEVPGADGYQVLVRRWYLFKSFLFFFVCFFLIFLEKSFLV